MEGGGREATYGHQKNVRKGSNTYRWIWQADWRRIVGRSYPRPAAIPPLQCYSCLLYTEEGVPLPCVCWESRSPPRSCVHRPAAVLLPPPPPSPRSSDVLFRVSTVRGPSLRWLRSTADKDSTEDTHCHRAVRVLRVPECMRSSLDTRFP